MSTQAGADRIEQVAFGFMASKVLFAAIEFGVFTELAKQPLDGWAGPASWAGDLEVKFSDRRPH